MVNDSLDGGDVVEDKKKSPAKGIFNNKKFLLSLSVLVAIILLITLPSRFETINGTLSDFNFGKSDNCKNIEDIGIKNNCYRDLAFDKNQTYYCGKVFNATSISSSCYAKLSVEANSKKSCEEISDVKARSYCLSQVAINQVELPLCANVEDIGWKNTCYSQLALITGKPDPCSMIEGNLITTADCYVDLANNLSSGGTCAYIPDQLKKDRCFKAIGVSTSDSLLCGEIVDPGNRWSCYHNIAKNTNDLSLCSNIPEEFRQNCFDAVAKANEEINSTS
jgi:hypothetical protein